MRRVTATGACAQTHVRDTIPGASQGRGAKEAASENPRGGKSTRCEEDEHQRNAPRCDASQIIQETGVELASQIIKLLLGILMGIREIKSVFHKGGV